ncbi:MAG TPA: hypothetical protein VMP01_09245 [Pirellulaceae bacterium]|nr:hypothetical protein [Pirellulaceae bacterium]
MPGMMEKLSAVNSFLRTLLAIVVLGVIGTAGYFGYDAYTAKERADEELVAARDKLKQVEAEVALRDEQIEKLNKDVADLKVMIEKLETRIALLKVDHRVAKLTVVEQGPKEEGGATFSTVEFVELNDEGHAIDTPRQFSLPGDTVYVDYLVVKFDDKYVEEMDIDRKTSICLFSRIFGDQQKPIDGYALDKVNSQPSAYARGGQMSDFEKSIWDDFWSIANDEAKAKEKGIRAAHGQALSMKVQKGKTYRIQLRASDGLSIVPDGDAATGEKTPR